MNKKVIIALLVTFALVFALASDYSISVDKSTYYLGEVVNITVILPMKVYAIKLAITLPSNETYETPAISCRSAVCLYQYIPDQPGHYTITMFERNVSVEFDVLENETAEKSTSALSLVSTPTLSQFFYTSERTNKTFIYYLIPTEEGYGDLVMENITPHLLAIVLYNFSINSSLYLDVSEINESKTITPQFSDFSVLEYENQTTNQTNINEAMEGNSSDGIEGEPATETTNSTSPQLEKINIMQDLNKTEENKTYYVVSIDLGNTSFSYAEFYFLSEYNTLLSCTNISNSTCIGWEKAEYIQLDNIAIVNTTENFSIFSQQNISYPLNVSENISLNVSEENISEVNITPLEDEVYKQLEVVFTDMGGDYYEDLWVYDTIEQDLQEFLIQNAFFVVYDEKGEGRIPEYLLSMIDEKHANAAIFKSIPSIPIITFNSLYLDDELRMTAYDINDSSFVLDTYYLFYPYAIVQATKKGNYLYSCDKFSYDYSCETGFKEISYTGFKNLAVFNITKEQKLFLWTEEPINIFGEEQNVTELIPSINIKISDSKGKNKNYSYEILDYTGRYASFTIYLPEDERVHSITLYNLSLSGNNSMVLDEFSDGKFLIDFSNMSFDSSLVVARDYGGGLYKCKEFDGSYSCITEWEKWPYFASGGFIVFKLLPEDPLFVQEINISNQTTLNILDPFGNPVNGTYEILDNSSGLDVQIDFNSGQVLQLIIYDMEDDGFSHTIVVGDTFVNDTNPNYGNLSPSNAPASIVDAFIVDLSNITYNYSNVVVKNSGHGVYKCSNFSYSNFSCLGHWQLYPSINNGINRSFNMSEGDPMFGYGGEENASTFDITSCTAITTSGVHTLDNNLLGDTGTTINSFYYCIAIRASNVELNCQNYEIRGNRAIGSSVGIIVYDPPLGANPLTNVTIRNCNVLNYTRNLWIDSDLASDHSQIVVRDSRFNLSSGNSIRVSDADNSNFTNIIVDRTTDGALLFLDGSSGNIVRNFTGLNSNNFFIMDYVGSNQFYNTTLRNGGWAGIWIRGVDNSIVDGFDIKNITESGGVVYGAIYVSSGGDYNIIKNGKIYDLITHGIKIEGTYNNITNVTIYNSTSESGIFIDGDAADNNRIENSTIYKNADYGIYVNGADNILLSGLTIENHTSGYEIYLQGSAIGLVSNVLIQNSRFVNNKTLNTMGVHGIYTSNITVDNSTFTNIYVGGYFNQSSLITVKNSTFLRNGKAGIFLDSTLNSVITNNTINDT
ncbi:MAG: right-handed parallel beta-helix repeat-containing protein, partial [Candidatus Micrarchaeia archaeon]